MKFLVPILFVSILITCRHETPGKDKHEQTRSQVVSFDSALALKLGADRYGMKQYVVALLKAGPNREMDSASRARIQRAHLDNIQKMAAEGTLVLAGPFTDNEETRGIYIFNVNSIEKARELTESDPAVKAGRLIMELHPWYGSAALMEINNLHKRISKEKI